MHHIKYPPRTKLASPAHGNAIRELSGPIAPRNPDDRQPYFDHRMPMPTRLSPISFTRSTRTALTMTELRALLDD